MITPPAADPMNFPLPSDADSSPNPLLRMAKNTAALLKDIFKQPTFRTQHVSDNKPVGVCHGNCKDHSS